MSEFKQELKLRTISLAAWALIHFLGHTARLRVIGFERVQEFAESGRGLILAVWHGRTLLPIHYCRGMGIWAITSLSKDGELQTRTVNRFGYRTIRGSSARGAVRAALTACKKLQEGGILAITPDGPKGPYREVQPGIIFLAQRANCPIIPIGAGAGRGKLASAWDEYLIPAPFARCSVIFGEPLYISEADTHAEKKLKDALDAVQRTAELEVKEDM